MIWQFTYIQKVAVILLFLGKNTRDNKSIFISQNNTTNPNLKEQFYIHIEDLQWVKRSKSK